MKNYDGGILVNGRRISNLKYADDTAIFAENIEDLERIMLELQRERELLGLWINPVKTKVMIIDRANNNQPNISKVLLAAETWTPKERDRLKLKAFEM